MAKKSCFIISPIGEQGSDIRRNADQFLQFIIKPALEPYNMMVYRGDHRAETNEIDMDVIESVHNADLCIVDLTGLNPNVMYELGRREETGKPMILMRTRGQALPVDLATHRCIEYDLKAENLLESVAQTQQQIRNFVDPMIEDGFAGDASIPTLKDIAMTLEKINRKVEKLLSGTKTGTISTDSSAVSVDSEIPEGLTPSMAFRLGLQQHNVALIESAMARLQQQMDKLKFLDAIVEVAASAGSVKAGEMLIQNAQEFMDSDVSFDKKYEYLGYLISYAGKRNEEERILELVENICAQLIMEINSSEGRIPEKKMAGIHNQKNRLYYGIYVNTDDVRWLDKAYHEVGLAIEAESEEGSYYYNLAKIYVDYYRLSPNEGEEYLIEAAKAVQRCISLDKKQDDDHLMLAYKLFRKLDLPQADDVMAVLEQNFPAVATYIKMNPDL